MESVGVLSRIDRGDDLIRVEPAGDDQ